ncbi:MAG: riboflavin transporter, partial [Erysipelotrichaceae bacterium]|nr:riboflavin transporter [Erysipelotrichaceae bacterium]
VIADPIVGYFYRKYLLGIPQEAAKIIATWVAGSTAINAVVCTIISVILYLALYKSFLPRLPKE